VQLIGSIPVTIPEPKIAFLPNKRKWQNIPLNYKNTKASYKRKLEKRVTVVSLSEYNGIIPNNTACIIFNGCCNTLFNLYGAIWCTGKPGFEMQLLFFINHITQSSALVGNKLSRSSA